MSWIGVRRWQDTWFRKSKNLSGYAAKNKYEAFAEGFAAIHHGTGAKSEYQRSLEILLEEVDQSKWLKDFNWLFEVTDESQKKEAKQALENLRRKLGV